MSIRRTVLEMRFSCIVLLYVGVSLTIGTCSGSSTRDEREMQDAQGLSGNYVRPDQNNGPSYSELIYRYVTACALTPGGSHGPTTLSERPKKARRAKKASPVVENLGKKVDTQGPLYPRLPRYLEKSPQYAMAVTGENAARENAVSYKRFVPEGEDQYFDKFIYFASLVQILGCSLELQAPDKIALQRDLYSLNPFTIFDHQSLCDEFFETGMLIDPVYAPQTPDEWKDSHVPRLTLTRPRVDRALRVFRNMAENERVVIYYLAKMKELNIEIQFDRVPNGSCVQFSRPFRGYIMSDDLVDGRITDTDLLDDAAVERLMGTLINISLANLNSEQIKEAKRILTEIKRVKADKKHWDEVLFYVGKRTDLIEPFPQIKDGRLFELDLSDDANLEFLMKTLEHIEKRKLKPGRIPQLISILVDIQSAKKFLENWDEELFNLTQRINFTQSFPQKYSDPMNSNGAIATGDSSETPDAIPPIIEFTASFPGENADLSRILGDVRDTFEQHLRTEYKSTGRSLRHVKSSAIPGRSENQ